MKHNNKPMYQKPPIVQTALEEKTSGVQAVKPEEQRNITTDVDTYKDAEDGEEVEDDTAFSSEEIDVIKTWVDRQKQDPLTCVTLGLLAILDDSKPIGSLSDLVMPYISDSGASLKLQNDLRRFKLAVERAIICVEEISISKA